MFWYLLHSEEKKVLCVRVTGGVEAPKGGSRVNAFRVKILRSCRALYLLRGVDDPVAFTLLYLPVWGSFWSPFAHPCWSQKILLSTLLLVCTESGPWPRGCALNRIAHHVSYPQRVQRLPAEHRWHRGRAKPLPTGAELWARLSAAPFRDSSYYGVASSILERGNLVTPDRLSARGRLHFTLCAPTVSSARSALVLFKYLSMNAELCCLRVFVTRSTLGSICSSIKVVTEC